MVPRSAAAAKNILSTIGETPLVRLRSCVPESGAEIWLKLDYFNPTGSMKDRMGLSDVYNRIADERVAQLLELARSLLADNVDHVAACCTIPDKAAR